METNIELEIVIQSLIGRVNRLEANVAHKTLSADAEAALQKRIADKTLGGQLQKLSDGFTDAVNAILDRMAVTLRDK
jgi:hypothetical protein